MKQTDPPARESTPLHGAALSHRSMRIGKRHDPGDDFMPMAPSAASRARQLHAAAPESSAAIGSAAVRSGALRQLQR